MTTKMIYMNEMSDDEYSEQEFDHEPEPEPEPNIQLPGCGNSECSDQEYAEVEFPDFYGNLEIVEEKKEELKGLSIDSSEQIKKPNFKCGSCKKSFLLDKTQKMIRCPQCGYRILFKLRTRNYITYKTE
jgi:DNA-directed RNA polymerase subunit RPC12/RpoP